MDSGFGWIEESGENGFRRSCMADEPYTNRRALTRATPKLIVDGAQSKSSDHPWPGQLAAGRDAHAAPGPPQDD